MIAKTATARSAPRVLLRALRLVWESGRGLALLQAALLVAEGALPVLLLYCVGVLVDAVASGGRDLSALAALVGALLLLAVAESLLRVVGDYVREAHGHAVADHIQDALHRKAVAVDLAYYADPSYHDTLHRVQLEAPYQPMGVLAALARLGRGAVLLVGTAALVATFHWAAAAVLLLAGAPGAIARLLYARSLRAAQLAETPLERRAQYLHYLLSSERHAEEIRLFDLGDLLAWRSRGIRASLRDAKLALARRRGIVELLSQVVVAACVFGCLGWMVASAAAGAMTIGALVMCFQAIQRGRVALADMTSSIGGLYERGLVLSQLHDFLAMPEPAPAAPAGRLTRGGAGALALEDVTFTYPRAPAPALRDVSLRIEPGELCAIVGASGSGKSTLLKLLCGLYRPERGRVLLDGVDLARIDPADTRRRFAVVPQDFGRYHFSARDNVWFGDVTLPADSAEIVRAAGEAGIARVLEGLPKGYDHMLGRLFEDGQELSAGQWQKVALARAFLRSSGILLLDEPTSDLDPRSESLILARLARDRGSRTVILVSHRLSAARDAHRIHVMEEGRIVESGDHETLLAKGAAYARLFEIQARPYA